MVQPINPLSSLSSILGIKQQQQNLQTGQYQQATAQAESQQAQQKNNELQGLATFTKNAAQDPSYELPDGTPDIGKYQKGAMAVAPTYGQPVIGQMSSNFKEAVETRRTLQALSSDQNATLMNGLKGVAGNPNATVTDMENMVSQLRDNNKDPSFNRALDHMLLGTNKQDIPGSAAKAAAYLGGISPQQGTNAAGQNQLVNPLTGARSMPALSGEATNPTSSQVAGETAANVSRAGGSGSADIDASNNVVAGQRDARTNIDLTKRIDQLADVVNPGTVAAKVSAGLGALGLQDVNQARTELQKDLGRLQTNYTSRAGSDERARTILSGLPTDTTPTQTIHQAMDVTRGSARQDLALGSLQAKNSKATNGQMNGFQSEYSHAVGAASPLMHEYWSLPKAEQAQFLKRNANSPQEAQQMRNTFEAARGQLNVGQ
jgi:hypothetical protein